MPLGSGNQRSRRLYGYPGRRESDQSGCAISSRKGRRSQGVSHRRQSWHQLLARRRCPHEVPQELGDFGILIHGGWKIGKALLYNFLSALTFLAGGLVAYGASFSFDVTFLLPFAAGNFIYIAATDLIPEIKHEENARLNSCTS
ncbi:MAG TPA: ZIP family metal transporter [Candidatus Binatia bacterium]|nr:ZIP family metal transporter [Candidatus Binatia bacterium]